MKAKPIVAFVGRPNVGKSTLFNRVIGRRQAIVEDLPGTTRDRIYSDADWGGRDFLVVDTGGLEISPTGRAPRAGPRAPSGHTTGVSEGLFLNEMADQVREAIEEADVIVFIVDAQTGLTGDDEDVARLLRRSHKPIVLAVNKCDNARLRSEAVDFYSLGLGEPYPVSALHGHGIGDLLDAVVEHLPFGDEVTERGETEDESVKIAIVGKPNVGKSSLLNRLIGQERAIVSEVPGTTRDAIDIRLICLGQEVTLIDTAGIRRRGKIEKGVERYSVLRTLKAIRRADVCLLMVDATTALTAQDHHIAGYVLDEHKSVVITVNKWDAIEKDAYTMAEFTAYVRSELHFLDYVPVVFISAKTGKRVDTVIPLCLQIHDERRQRLSTGTLMRLLNEAMALHPPPAHKGRPLRFYYATQPAVDPPTFVFFVNDKELVHFSYQRYLENKIRERYPYVGTPLKLIFRSHREQDRKAERSRR